MPISQYQHPRNYYKEIISDSPISFWPFDDFAAGTVIADLAALHNGIATGDSVVKAQAGPGRGLDWAITLGGTADGIAVGDFAEYEFAGDFTAECWFFQTAAADAMLIGKRQSASGEWRLTVSSAGLVECSLQNTASGSFLFASGPAASLNAWHHAAMVASGTTLTVYLDGVSATASTTTGTRRTSSAELMSIGFQGFSTFLDFTGRLSAPALYSSALTAARLLEHIKAAMR